MPPPNEPNMTPEQLTEQQRWEQHRLNKLLQSQQDDMQKKANKLPFKKIYYPTLAKGALVTFQYLHWKHDPYPMVLVSSIYAGPPRPGLVAGVNLHYLTFRFVKQMIQMYCDKQFSYSQIKANLFVYNSFRTYKRSGLRQLKRLDCEYLMQILGAVRSYNSNEVEAIRKYVQEQLRRMANPTAEDLAKQYSEMIQNNPQGARYADYQDQIGKLYGKLPQPPVVPPYNKQTRGDARLNPRNISPP